MRFHKNFDSDWYRVTDAKGRFLGTVKKNPGTADRRIKEHWLAKRSPTRGGELIRDRLSVVERYRTRQAAAEALAL